MYGFLTDYRCASDFLSSFRCSLLIIIILYSTLNAAEDTYIECVREALQMDERLH